jgi:hypothetical protein
MSLAVNGAKTGLANLIDLVNYSNPTAVQIAANQVEFNNLAVCASGGANTEVNIKAVNGQGFINGSAHPTGFLLYYNFVLLS